ncbi:coiled-coil domain-containing protein 96-like [Bactrocera neohumeralis]|uniref:coiled-coil domain-containing protein 96-like n=1 Tax=Bactrocera neohumeralis TaxID=98809 RepID=UPI0021653E52|nr:coiled-coil domain-containing protein 96-like [Bactrocera neohumeralis]
MEKDSVRIVEGEDVTSYKKEDSKYNFQVGKSALKSSKVMEPEAPEERISIEETAKVTTVFEVLDEDLLSSESESTTSSRDVRESEESSEDFFEKLGTIPDIAAIAVGETQMGKDVGSFVDPLTGMLYESTEEEEEGDEEGMVEEESSTTEDEDISEDEELLELLKRDEEVEAPKVMDESEVFETFMEMEKKQVIEEITEFDWIAYEREKELKSIAADTVIFLKELIVEVVEKSEYVDPNIFLRQHLDKASLIEEITKKMKLLEVEQKARSFLNRRVAEFFYRKGQYRVFTDDPPETILDEMNKLKDATNKLDQMLCREEDLKSSTQQEIANTQQDVSVLQIKNQEKLQEFEELVKKSLAKKGEHLTLEVDKDLRKMAKLREEISDARYILVQKQHSNATLSEQLKKLENLGNNFQMREFESLQNECQALDKKIEERNAELVRSRVRCNADLHVLGHLKEKQAMIRSKIKIQKSCLAMLQAQKYTARKCIFDSKKQRSEMRKEIKELSYQCGLLDKPALMLDFDNTVEQINIVMEKVDKLRNKHDEILRKIVKLEAKCL